MSLTVTLTIIIAATAILTIATDRLIQRIRRRRAIPVNVLHGRIGALKKELEALRGVVETHIRCCGHSSANPDGTD